MNNGHSHLPRRSQYQHDLRSRYLSGPLEPAIDVMRAPQIHEDEGCLLDRDWKPALDMVEVGFEARHVRIGVDPVVAARQV